MRKQEQPQESTEQSLSMARRSLGRVKEMDLSPVQKETVLAMIKQAKKLESEKELHKALLIYNQVLDLMKKIKAENENFNAPGITPKELWDWEIDQRLLGDKADYDQRYGRGKYEPPIFTKDGENIIFQAEEKDRWVLLKNGGIQLESDGKMQHVKVSDDGQHFAAVVNGASVELGYNIVTDKGSWEHAFKKIKDLKFSPDGNKLAVLIEDKLPALEKPYFYIYENEEIIYEGRENSINEFAYSPDSQRIAVISTTKGLTEDELADQVQNGNKKWDLHDTGLKFPTYSPDGEKLAVVDENDQILIDDNWIDMDPNINPADGQPVFSPDNKKIAYKISVMVDGDRFYSLAEDDKQVWDKKFDWMSEIIYDDSSHNIAAIVIAPNHSMETNRWRIAVNGKFVDRDAYEKCKYLTFSPDSKKIMFVGLKDGKYYRIVKDVSEYVK